MPTASTNPIATAYFRAVEEEAESTQEGDSPSARETAAHHEVTDVSAPAKASVRQVRGNDDIPTTIEAVIELLTEAGVMPERPRALLEAADEDPRAAKLLLLRRLMEFVMHHDETAYLAHS